MEYVRTLDFAEVEGDDLTLSPEQEAAIQQGLESLASGKGIPHQEVMNQTRKKFPHLFGNA